MKSYASILAHQQALDSRHSAQQSAQQQSDQQQSAQQSQQQSAQQQQQQQQSDQQQAEKNGEQDVEERSYTPIQSQSHQVTPAETPPSSAEKPLMIIHEEQFGLVTGTDQESRSDYGNGDVQQQKHQVVSQQEQQQQQQQLQQGRQKVRRHTISSTLFGQSAFSGAVRDLQSLGSVREEDFVAAGSMPSALQQKQQQLQDDNQEDKFQQQQQQQEWAKSLQSLFPAMDLAVSSAVLPVPLLNHSLPKKNDINVDVGYDGMFNNDAGSENQQQQFHEGFEDYQAQSRHQSLFENSGSTQYIGGTRPQHQYQLQKSRVSQVSSVSCYLVQFTSGRTDTFHVPPGQSELMCIQVGDYIVVEADRGEDLGRVIMDSISVPLPRRNSTSTGCYEEHQLMLQQQQPENGNVGNNFPKKVLRVASGQEVASLHAKMRDEMSAIQVGQYKVQEWKLPMAIIDAEYQWDRRKLTYYFSVTLPSPFPNQPAPRIDFRTLVRDLYQIYRTRIWMFCVDKDGGYKNNAHQREKFLKQLNADTQHQSATTTTTTVMAASSDLDFQQQTTRAEFSDASQVQQSSVADSLAAMALSSGVGNGKDGTIVNSGFFGNGQSSLSMSSRSASGNGENYSASLFNNKPWQEFDPNGCSTAAVDFGSMSTGYQQYSQNEIYMHGNGHFQGIQSSHAKSAVPQPASWNYNGRHGKILHANMNNNNSNQYAGAGLAMGNGAAAAGQSNAPPPYM